MYVNINDHSDLNYKVRWSVVMLQKTFTCRYWNTESVNNYFKVKGSLCMCL